MPGTDPKGLRQFQHDLAQRLGKLGLTGKETMVVYESRFGMRAARIAWMLEYAGASHVFLLEGGFRDWQKHRFPVETRIPKRDEETFRIKPVPSVLATADEVRSGHSARVLDVRSEGEFRGTEGRDCDVRRGRIPRADWFEWTEFIKDGQKFRSRSEIDRLLRERRLDRNRSVFTYCHRGARAAAAFYALRSLGFRDVRNYIGSWHEWSARKGLPVEK